MKFHIAYHSELGILELSATEKAKELSNIALLDIVPSQVTITTAAREVLRQIELRGWTQKMRLPDVLLGSDLKVHFMPRVNAEAVMCVSATELRWFCPASDVFSQLSDELLRNFRTVDEWSPIPSFIYAVGQSIGLVHHWGAPVATAAAKELIRDIDTSGSAQWDGPCLFTDTHDLVLEPGACRLNGYENRKQELLIGPTLLFNGENERRGPKWVRKRMADALVFPASEAKEAAPTQLKPELNQLAEDVAALEKKIETAKTQTAKAEETAPYHQEDRYGAFLSPRARISLLRAFIDKKTGFAEYPEFVVNAIADGSVSAANSAFMPITKLLASVPEVLEQDAITNELANLSDDTLREFIAEFIHHMDLSREFVALLKERIQELKTEVV